MALKQTATRVEEDQYELFRATTKRLGTTPADALRIFIHSFNEHGGFPYDVRTVRPVVEAFDSEEDATRFATDISMECINAAR